MSCRAKKKKKSFITCEAGKDSDQPVHKGRLTSLHCWHKASIDPRLSINKENTDDSCRTEQQHRLMSSDVKES